MKKDWKFGLEHILLLVTSIGQILIAILIYRQPANTWIRNIGWVILWIAGIFGSLPIFTLKNFGGVETGNSYIDTNRLVDKGLYTVVRHPQYLAGILISIGLFLISPHWTNFALGLINISQYYSGSFEEEKELIKKFGQDYIDYAKSVPRFNFVCGIVKRMWESIK